MIEPVGTFAKLPPEVQARFQREHGQGRTDAKSVHGGDVINLVAANHDVDTEAN
ncbi:hypothetical protein [Cupriavidus taiwanensis]|uniref:hypothetical protein n=1 Tax=Cupriavidus taiwanensis TaxID=164546 RepID=UPI0012FF4F10|nr:hypothetical protein [Cupriavidus taiwanensis]